MIKVFLILIYIMIESFCEDINFDELRKVGIIVEKSVVIPGIASKSKQYSEQFDGQDTKLLESESNKNSFSGGNGKSNCFSIRNDDTKYACLANFEGKSTCFSIRNDDTKYACLANFD